MFAGLKDGEGVILDTQTTAYFGLNKTAAFLWERLQEAREISVADLARALCARFVVDEAQAVRDVQEFLGRVVKYGLARRIPAATPAGP